MAKRKQVYIRERDFEGFRSVKHECQCDTWGSIMTVALSALREKLEKEREDGK